MIFTTERLTEPNLLQATTTHKITTCYYPLPKKRDKTQTESSKNRKNPRPAADYFFEQKQKGGLSRKHFTPNLVKITQFSTKPPPSKESSRIFIKAPFRMLQDPTHFH